MSRAAQYLVLCAGLLICAAPGIAAFAALAIAEAHGCTLHEGFANPCVINGTDRGEALAGALVAGWFMLFTMPVLLIFVLLLILRIVRDIRGGR